MRKDSQGYTQGSRELEGDGEGEEGDGIWMRNLLENDKQGKNFDRCSQIKKKEPGNRRRMALPCYALLLFWWGPSSAARNGSDSLKRYQCEESCLMEQ